MEEYIQEILENLLESLGVDYQDIHIETITGLDEQEEYYCNINTSNASLLIGKGGQNLMAFQVLAKLILKKRLNQNPPSLRIDVDSYRQRQIENCLGLAEKYVDKLNKTKTPQNLPPMKPFYRRIVHMHIAEHYPDIQTESHGRGEHRHIVIKL
ncbi:hypothetical protein CL656_02030 [bacterium]|nr:hypothetical protein [bacterium]|tara:strand:+ start:3849 stop:4310 length:462 start_codon:yes stop_codon:yes gene_type:complete